MAPLPAQMCLPGAEFGDVRVRPGGAWVSAVLAETTDGVSRTSLVMWNLADGSMSVLVTDPAPALFRGFSGGVHDWHPDGLTLVYVAVDGTLHRLHVDTRCTEPVAAESPRRWWGPAHSPDGRRLAVVADWCELLTIEHDGTFRTVHHEPDGYVMDAAWFGNEPTAHRWTRPAMSWTTSGLVGESEEAGVSVQQPRRVGSGRGWVSDASGVWNVHVDGVPVDDGCEHAGPVWGPGQRTWCADGPGSTVAYARNEFGFGSLWVLDRPTGARTLVGRGVHGCLSLAGGTLAALRSGARTPPEVVVYDVSEPGSPRRTHRFPAANDGWSGFDDQLVEPTVHAADDVPYRLYSPPRSAGRLIVWVHGGPTDQWQVTWRPRFTHWLSRGWTIAVPDHRGSTGHGRSFRLALEGRWGELDADDTALVTRHVQTVHGFEPSRTALMGSSAGGLTVLSAAARHAALAACVVVSYPVTDLRLLGEGEDPFEGHYNRVLVGDVDSSPATSPGHLATVPVLSFHGDLDGLVPPAHSHRLRDAVAAVGGSVTVVMMPGEGHGFRGSASMMREFALTQEFLDENVGLT